MLEKAVKYIPSSLRMNKICRRAYWAFIHYIEIPLRKCLSPVIKRYLFYVGYHLTGKLSFVTGEIFPIPDNDARGLEKLVQMVLREKVMIAEVGSWTGKSTSILAKAVADYHGSVYAVDSWMGSKGTPQPKYANLVDIYSIFKRSMIRLGVWDIVHPLVMDSQTASRIFADGILDLVFIDADHRYEYVKQDIASWLPKVRDGGILCGHDCTGHYSKYPEGTRKMIDKHLEGSSIGNIYPGVAKALYEHFQDSYLIVPNSAVWYYIKEPTVTTSSKTKVKT